MLAAGDAHTLGTLLEIDKAIAVHIPQITGVYPCQSIGMGLERCGGLLRVMEIAHHHCGTGKADFAICAVGHLVLCAMLYNFIVCIRERDAMDPSREM